MRVGIVTLWVAGVVLNALVAWKLVTPYWRTHEARAWPETVCTIARTTDEGPDDERVSYAYALGGQAYLAERIDFLGCHYPHTFDEGAEYPCWYDPSDPGTSVLVREDLWRASDWLLILIYAALAGGISLVVRRKVGAIALRVLLVMNLVAIAWLAQDGGASGVHAAGLTLVAAAASVWLIVSLRPRKRVPEARIN